MKTTSIILLSVVGLSHAGFAAETDPDVLALGKWSEPVANKNGFALRGRLLICGYPEHRGLRTGTDAALYVDLQEYSDSVGAVGEVKWDPAALACELTDKDGKTVPKSSAAYGGPVPAACWIKLPSHSSMRLRVSPYAGGRLADGGFGLWATMPQVWTLKPDDENTYYLSGDFTATAGEDHRADNPQWVWTGKLKLPALEVSIKKLEAVKQRMP